MPVEYGIYTTASMLMLYLNYIQFGVLNSYNRDYPQLLGAKKNDAALEMKNAVFTFLLVVYSLVVVLLVTIIIALIVLNKIDMIMGVGLISNSFFALLNILYNFMDNTYRSEKKFNYSSFLNILQTLLLIAIGLVVVRECGYYGMLISYGCSFIIVLVINWKTFLLLKLNINIKLIKNMIRFGLPLLINGLVMTFLMTISNFVILFFMSMKDLGIYSIALLGFNTLMLIPLSLSQIFYVKMSHKYGETGDAAILLNFAKRYSLYIAIILSYIAIFAYFLLPIFINNILPNYRESIKAAQILIMGAGIYGTTILFSNIFSILKQNAILFSSTILLALATLLLTSGLILAFGREIEFVAYGMSVSYVIYALILCVLLSRIHKRPPLELLRFSVFPVSISLLITLGITQLIENVWQQFILIILILSIVLIIMFNKTIIEKIKRVRSH